MENKTGDKREQQMEEEIEVMDRIKLRMKEILTDIEI